MNAITSISDLKAAEHRLEKRTSTIKSGKLIYGGAHPVVIDCLVLDLSDSGARVETIIAADIPEVVLLRTGSGAEARTAYRRWASGQQIGLEFAAESAQTLAAA
jgi:hypothetical protein